MKVEKIDPLQRHICRNWPPCVKTTGNCLWLFLFVNRS